MESSAKTVRKWRLREQVVDRKTGPKDPRSTVLSPEQEAVVAFRRHTLLPLDDCLYALQATISALTRSSLHRCLLRRGISRLPGVEGDKRARNKFASYPIGCFHVDIAEVRTAEDKLHLFVAIDRTSRFAFVQLLDRPDMAAASGFLEALVEAVLYRIYRVLTDNGMRVHRSAENRLGPTARFPGHPFDRVCRSHDIEHRLIKPNHPWTNGQVERMNRTIKDATLSRYHYDSHEKIGKHLDDFILAYNFARRLKTLKGLTPYQLLCKSFLPEQFRLNPIHQMPGPYS